MPDDTPSRRSCGVMEVHRQLLSADPEYREARAELESVALDYEAREVSIAARKVRTIPVVVHVVYRRAAQNISDAQVKSQIRILNRDFRKRNADASKVPAPFKSRVADTRVQFRLARKDIFGRESSGITRTKTSVPAFGFDDGVKSSRTGGADPWPARRYLNVWVCRLDGLLGYAQFPGGPNATDGVVVLQSAFGNTGTATPPFDKGRTATHEVGHWLNLFHIWGDDGTGCAASDLVADTPNQGDENYGCPTFPEVSCGNGPNGDMFMNYMDYTDDRCMFMFTKGQARRMNATLDKRRSALFEPLPRFPGVLKRSPKRKESVRKVQVRLREHFGNPGLKADGVFGPVTEGVVSVFENNRRGPPWRLEVDGVIGRRTWAALWA